MALIREGVAALQRDKERELFSDMHSLAELLNRGEVFAHGPPLVRQVDTLLETMSQGKAFDKSVCNETKDLMALHFSHKSTGKQYRGLARPLAMAQLLQQWPEDCGADVFDYHTQLMDDNVGRISPEDGAKHSSSGAISKDDEVSQEHTPSHVALTHNNRIERDRNSDSGHMNKQDRKNLDLCDTNDKSTCMLADIADAKAQLRTTPFFWHIPKAGGTSLKRLLTSCLNLLDASNRGSFHDKNETLFVVRLGPGNGQRTVNVNLATKAGIQRARQLGLAESGLADVVASPLFLEASSLFTPENKGVAFAVFRHPVERAASLFHYLQHAEWEPTYNPELKNMPIEEFAKSNLSEENWVVRSLVGKLDGGEVSTEDLKVAKDIVRRKVIVGLTSDMETTVKRFSDFFGWDLRDAKKSCLERTVYRGENKNVHPQVVEGSAAWPLLVERNRFDLDLYDYVLDVFKKQGDWLSKKTALVPSKKVGTGIPSSTDFMIPFSEFISNVMPNSSAQVFCGRTHFATNCAECPSCHGHCKWLLTNSTTTEGKCVTKVQFDEETGCGILDKVEPLDPSKLDVNCENINEVTIGQLLGNGATKIAYKGYWNDRVYAVKMTKSSSIRLNNQKYTLVNLTKREAMTLKEATLLHGLRGQPNIMPLVGFCNGVVFTELGKPLTDFFHHAENVTPKTRLQYALDIARSVDQIHSIPGALLVHGDLALKQYHLLGSGTVVLGDLDTAHYVGGSSNGEKERCGKTLSGNDRNVAPEQLAGIAEGRHMDEKTDIYALANMIWSLLSNERIFQDVDFKELPAKIKNGLRPNVTKLEGYPQTVAEVLLECWAMTPEYRPTARYVVARIEEAFSSMK